jgi:hypothetical protein
MQEISPEDIRFDPEISKAIVLDLFEYAFNSPREKRSEEYESGFRDNAFNNLLLPKYEHLKINPPFPMGTCQRDAWYAGADEGLMAVRSFQINYVEAIQQNKKPTPERTERSSNAEDVSFSFT